MITDRFRPFFFTFAVMVGSSGLEPRSNVPRLMRSFLHRSFYLLRHRTLTDAWWAQVDSNHRPRAYQARALTS